MSKLPKHHYIPVFYLSQWALGQAKGIVEFSRPYNDEVKPRPTTPKGTGYIRGLNLIHTLPPEQAERFETVILQKLDSLAATALHKLLHDAKTPWAVKPRSAWTRFLLSILLRNPESVERAVRYMQNAQSPAAEESRKLYEANKRPIDPSFEEFLKVNGKHAAFQAILDIFNRPALGDHINRMLWSVHTLPNTRFPLLTSDRPLITTNGVGLPESYMVMPISPNAVFVGVNRKSEFERINSMPSRDFAETINVTVVQNAVKYVWASDDSQLRFIQNNMSSNVGSDEWLMSGLGPKT